jgi:hypothetical protein
MNKPILMNKPNLMPQLSATRARTGMRSIGELITLLIKQYELQDQLRAKQQAAASARRLATPQSAASSSPSRPASTASAPGRSHARVGAPNSNVAISAGGSSAGGSSAGANSAGANRGATAEFSNSRTAQGVTKPIQATFAWFDAPATEPVVV